LKVTFTVRGTVTKSEPATADSDCTQYLRMTLSIGAAESEIVKV
jgi:hypothetical protein